MIRLAERAALAALHRLDPERAHDLSLRALRSGLIPLPGPVTSERLRVRLAGLDLPNPVGLAAGYDKDAVAVAALMRSGFGFLEVGAATPRPQQGNPRPRLFRLSDDRAVINRFGFNNEGAEAIAARLARRPAGVPVGLNLGAGRDSADRLADFAAVLRIAGAAADFVTVNVSSPNTAGLRDLQGRGPLRALLEDVVAARAELPNRPPVFVKIAPDLDFYEIDGIAGIAMGARVDGLIATNTTLSREGASGPHSAEAGGLSGTPLFERSTRVLATLHIATAGELPVIGVGGVATARDVLTKIEAGATAVQLYTALAYEGISLAARLPRELDALLAERGMTAAEAVGTRYDEWFMRPPAPRSGGSAGRA